MQIGIIGTGNMGKALHKALSRAGHEVVLGSRKSGDVGGIKTVSIKDAAAFGSIIVLATPFEAAKESLSAAGHIEGKTLIDITNPLAPDFSALTIGHTTSGGEQIAGLARGAKVVKAFNHIFSAAIEQGAEYAGARPLGLYCGDDAGAKATVAQLIQDIGFDAIDAGGITSSRDLEAAAMLIIKLGFMQGLGPQIAFSLLRR
jgi:predicted dinucleotide-binding enzyme